MQSPKLRKNLFAYLTSNLSRISGQYRCDVSFIWFFCPDEFLKLAPMYTPSCEFSPLCLGNSFTLVVVIDEKHCFCHFLKSEYGKNRCDSILFFFTEDFCTLDQIVSILKNHLYAFMQSIRRNVVGHSHHQCRVYFCSEKLFGVTVPSHNKQCYKFLHQEKREEQDTIIESTPEDSPGSDISKEQRLLAS